MIQQVVRIENDLGLHARAAAKLVRLTARFEADIKLSTRSPSRTVDGKSILGILLLAASQGTEVEITADGKDEQEAMQGIVDLVEGRFGE